MLPSTMESKNKPTRLGTPAHRQRMLQVERTRKVTVSKHHTMTVYWNVKTKLLAFLSPRHNMDENGRLRLNGLQALLISCGTLVTKSEFSQNASKVKGLFFGAKIEFISTIYPFISRSQWPRGLRRRSTAARLLRSWVRIPPRAWMYVL